MFRPGWSILTAPQRKMRGFLQLNRSWRLQANTGPNTQNTKRPRPTFSTLFCNSPFACAVRGALAVASVKVQVAVPPPQGSDASKMPIKTAFG